MKRNNALLVVFLAVGAILTAVCFFHHENAVSERKRSEIILRDAATREAWLNLHGFSVTAVLEEDCRLPLSYRTDVGTCWLSLQHAQGLSPESHGGESGTRYLYRVENLPGDTFYAELLIVSDVLVGAMVYDAQGGRMERIR